MHKYLDERQVLSTPVPWANRLWRTVTRIAILSTSTDKNPEFIFPEGGKYIVTLTVEDEDGDTSSKGHIIFVFNAIPIVNAGADQTVIRKVVASLDPATFTDNGMQDTHTATINWGDGSAEQPGMVDEIDGSGAVSGTHTYVIEGTFTVTVRVTDDNSATGCDQLVITVPPFDDPPELSAIGDQALFEGAILNIDIQATDPEGEPVSLAASGLPEFAGFVDNGGGSATLSLAPDF